MVLILLLLSNSRILFIFPADFTWGILIRGEAKMGVSVGLKGRLGPRIQRPGPLVHKNEVRCPEHLLRAMLNPQGNKVHPADTAWTASCRQLPVHTGPQHPFCSRHIGVKLGAVENHQHCPKPTRLRNEGSPSNRRAGQGPRGTQTYESENFSFPFILCALFFQTPIRLLEHKCLLPSLNQTTQ